MGWPPTPTHGTECGLRQVIREWHSRVWTRRRHRVREYARGLLTGVGSRSDRDLERMQSVNALRSPSGYGVNPLIPVREGRRDACPSDLAMNTTR